MRKGLLRKLLPLLNQYFLACYVINFISMIIIGNPEPFGEGLYFLGYNNRFIYTFFPWVICAGLMDLFDKKRLSKRYYIVLILTESILLYKWSVSAMLALGLFLFVPLITNKKIGYKIIFTLNLIINYVITYISLDTVAPIKAIINDFLQKDMTFTGRTYMWKGVYNSMSDDILLGHGMQSIEDEKNFFFSTSGDLQIEYIRVQHAHNSLMTILYRGGLLSLISYIWILLIVIKNISKKYKSLFAPLLLCGYIVILVLSLFDTIDFAFLFFFFGICVYIPGEKKYDVIENEKKGLRVVRI